MKNAFQETKKSNFLYYGIILVSVLLEVIMIWQLDRLIPLLYPGFVGFLVFHLVSSIHQDSNIIPLERKCDKFAEMFY